MVGQWYLMKGKLSPMLVEPAKAGDLANTINICLGLSSETHAIWQRNYSVLLKTQMANVQCKHHLLLLINECKFPRIEWQAHPSLHKVKYQSSLILGFLKSVTWNTGSADIIPQAGEFQSIDPLCPTYRRTAVSKHIQIQKYTTCVENKATSVALVNKPVSMVFCWCAKKYHFRKAGGIWETKQVIFMLDSQNWHYNAHIVASSL